MIDHSASIIVNNFNYGRYLREAIDSALAQTWDPVEVVVVDDGSTDASRDIIAGYGDRIVPVLKEHGGQGSTFNAGFAASTGSLVLFLDADDVLRTSAVATARPLFDDPTLATVQWRLTVIDREGRATSQRIPRRRPPHGDLTARVVSDGPDLFRWAPTSGAVWSRRYLEQVLPAPSLYDYGVDCYLFQLVPFFGRVAALDTSESFYRLHGGNDSRTIGFERKLRRQLAYYDDYSRRALEQCRRHGWDADPERWRRHSWWCQLDRAVRDLDETLAPARPLVLVDENSWGTDEQFRGRPVLHFLDRGGRYWGPPADDAAACAELSRLHDAGASSIVFAWKSFWMLQHFPALARRLEERHRQILSDARLRVFELDGGRR
jgi:glycosyltransferase involved in cell wall biosynthesis